MKNIISPKILVVGDIMLDQFVWGTTDRISPEAPVPVVRLTEEKQMLGGAGNVVRNLNALGAEVKALGIIGDDSNGMEIAKLFEKENNSYEGLLCSKDYQTIVKTRIISDTQHIVRLDMEGDRVSDQDSVCLHKMSAKLIEWADLILVADYGKGVVNKSLIETLNASGKKVIVDPTLDTDFSIYDKVWMVKPNLKEAKNAIRHLPGTDKMSPHEIAGNILKKYDISRVLVTLAGDGMLYTELGSLYWNKPFTAKHDFKEIRDVSGAGDTVLAVLGFCLAHTPSSIQTAIGYANKAGSIVVGKLGTASVSQEELFGVTK